MLATRNRLADRLLAHGLEPLPSVAIGFDGFIDEMIRVVRERKDVEHLTPVRTIAEFGALIAGSAGHSSLREIVVSATHAGGCAINMGDGLAALGVPVDCFATLGEPPHPVFAPVTGRFRSHQTWGRESGRTLAYEFDDGKLMFCSVSQLGEFTPEYVAARLSDGAYARACNGARMIALTNWSMYPHMTAVWRHLLDNVYTRLTHRPSFFIDIVDPNSRAAADVHSMLALLPRFQSAGPVTLGLNGNEANCLARLLDAPSCRADVPESAGALASVLRLRLTIDEVIVHFPKQAALATDNDVVTAQSLYCDAPRKSTGVGDRFNAGYALGRLLGFSAEERLLCAVGCAGFFVREARSPSLAELAAFLKRT